MYPVHILGAQLFITSKTAEVMNAPRFEELRHNYENSIRHNIILGIICSAFSSYWSVTVKAAFSIQLYCMAL
eukprot:m.311964 g.311964  ORF g.311964 m.311964 type:complete len:72 (+) comp184918_c0_seq1:24-239(+)